MRLPTISQDHNKMDLKLVGKNILAMVEENEQLTILTFIAFVRQEFGYTITYHNAWLAKQWALEKVYSNWEESYNILPKYLQALQLFVPGTIVRIQTIPILDESNQPIPNKVTFHRLFWSFKACIDAFVFCKPIVQIDGTWLYGRYKGTLLVAVANFSKLNNGKSWSSTSFKFLTEHVSSLCFANHLHKKNVVIVPTITGTTITILLSFSV